MENSPDRLESILAKLRQRKFRITPQRVAIISCFLNSDAHPSVEQVYTKVKSQHPTTSLATVYKTVILLKEIGEILEIGFADGRNRYDGQKPYPHPHLICLQCNEVVDPEIGHLPEMTGKVAQSSGYRILSHQVEFFGICPACQKKQK